MLYLLGTSNSPPGKRKDSTVWTEEDEQVWQEWCEMNTATHETVDVRVQSAFWSWPSREAPPAPVDVTVAHIINRAEKHRELAIQTIDNGVMLLRLAQHALTKNRLHKTEEYIERVCLELDEARFTLEERPYNDTGK